MIIPDLHRQPVGLDPAKHRALTLPVPLTDWSPAAGLSAIFLTAAECVHAARDFPIVFIVAGKNDEGGDDVAPVAVLGIHAGENLYVGANGRWRASHVPAVLATYPLCVARIDARQYAVCLDESWPGLQADAGSTGQRLFDDAGEPAALLRDAQTELQRVEQQVDQTRAIGHRLAALGLLEDRRLDGTLPDGSTVKLDGFMMVNEERVNALSDEDALSLHKDGLLALIHAHWISLGHMRRLFEWRAERLSASASPPAAAAAGV
ncbi:MAG: SapC family protein [Rubrivivax sp.]